MIPEPLTVRSAIFMILAGVLANNYIFEKALGAAPMFGYRRNRDLPLLGLQVAIVMIITAPLLRAVEIYILAPFNLVFLQNLVFTAVILIIVYLASLLYKQEIRSKYFLLLAVNSAVFTLAANTISEGLELPAAFLTGLGVGLGYLLALFLYAGLRERIDDYYLPKTFRGLPVDLLAAAIISMALLAFK